MKIIDEKLQLQELKNLLVLLPDDFSRRTLAGTEYDVQGYVVEQVDLLSGYLADGYSKLDRLLTHLEAPAVAEACLALFDGRMPLLHETLGRILRLGYENVDERAAGKRWCRAVCAIAWEIHIREQARRTVLHASYLA